MQQISPRQLHDWLQDGSRNKPVLLDVREQWEFDACRIPGSKHMPMRTIPVRYAELDPNADIVVICHHGARSFQVAMFLEHQGISGVINLQGGIAAWARDVDSGMRQY